MRSGRPKMGTNISANFSSSQTCCYLLVQFNESPLALLGVHIKAGPSENILGSKSYKTWWLPKTLGPLIEFLVVGFSK